MTTDSLVDDSPIVAFEPESAAPRRRLMLEPAQRSVLIVVLAAVVVAVAAPYPVTKLALGATLGLFWAKLFFELDERFVGMFVLLLPTLQLAPLETLGIPALNWQTIFLIIFVAATAERQRADGEERSARLDHLLLDARHSLRRVRLADRASAAVAAARHRQELAVSFLAVLSWPSTGERPVQLWFLVLCVAVVSLALAPARSA